MLCEVSDSVGASDVIFQHSGMLFVAGRKGKGPVLRLFKLGRYLITGSAGRADQSL